MDCERSHYTNCIRVKVVFLYVSAAAGHKKKNMQVTRTVLEHSNVFDFFFIVVFAHTEFSTVDIKSTETFPCLSHCHYISKGQAQEQAKYNISVVAQEQLKEVQI